LLPTNVYAVIPAFHESSIIAEVVGDVRRHIHNVVVVDDGSDDGTSEAAAVAGALVLRHAVNRGQGAALATGLRYALQAGADVVATFDADGQHQADDLPRLVEPVLSGRADVVLGSRFLEAGDAVPPLRRAFLKAAVVFTRLATGLPVTDSHNGLRAMSRAAAERIRIRQDRMAHASEILAQVAQHGFRCLEVPVTIRYTPYSRAKGQSALGALRVLLDLWVGRGVK
jgi:glycosyltransferase involved in cell wall biosynthesis